MLKLTLTIQVLIGIGIIMLAWGFYNHRRKEKELHQQLMEEKRAAQYQKHYDICTIDVLELVDLATKTAEYRELTQK